MQTSYPVSGVGENTRSTALGGGDTVAEDTSSAGAGGNSATRGRAEVDQGMANIHGENARAVAEPSSSAGQNAGTGGAGTGGAGTDGARTGLLQDMVGSGAAGTTQAEPVEQQGSAGGFI